MTANPGAARHATTEAQWLAQVRDLARLWRWEFYHPWLSVHSAAGWPDVALVRPPRLILAELKRDDGRTSAEQERWLGLLRACPGVEVYVWRPSDLDRVVETLR
jgi:hypothetical protein